MNNPPSNDSHPSLSQSGDAVNAAAPHVHVHIERLIIDGIPMHAAIAPGFQAAFETELATLIQTNSHGTWRAASIPAIETKPLELTAGDAAEHWGQSVARKVYSSIAPGPRDQASS